MPDRFTGWIERYISAWNSNDPREIEALFADDARYYEKPHSEPWVGPEAIAREWIGRKDEPGGWTFEYEVIARDGDLGIVKGTTRYTKPQKLDYSNLWAVRLDDQDRCTEFTEWWMEIPS